MCVCVCGGGGGGVGGKAATLGPVEGVLVEPEAPPAVAGEDVVQVLGPTGPR